MENHLALSLADALTYVIDKDNNIVTRSILDISRAIAKKEGIELEEAYFEFMEFSFCQQPKKRADGEEDESISYICVGTDKVLRHQITEDFEDLVIDNE